MASACTRTPLVIMIDGIDQVRDFGCQSCEWLPESLPENLKLILSVDETSDMFETIKAKISDLSNLVKVKLYEESYILKLTADIIIRCHNWVKLKQKVS
jgi:hypothetical protein